MAGKTSADRKLRRKLADNIKQKWKLPNIDGTVFPERVRHGGELHTWPTKVLRALNDLATGMPGIDESELQTLMERLGIEYDTRIESSSAVVDHPSGLEDIDVKSVIEGLRRKARIQDSEKALGKRKTVTPDPQGKNQDTGEFLSDTNVASGTGDTADDTLTVRPSKRRNVSTSHATRENTITEDEEESSNTADEEPQDDDAHTPQAEDSSSTAAVSPATQSTLWDVMKDEIKECWNLPKEYDIKDLIPDHMKDKDHRMAPQLDKELEKYWRPKRHHKSQKKGGLVRQLLELARASRNRMEEAQRKMEESFMYRRGSTIGKVDVRYALNHFRDEMEEGEDMAGPSGSNSRLQSCPQSPPRAPTTNIPPESIAASPLSIPQPPSQTPVSQALTPHQLPTSPLLTTLQDLHLRQASLDVTIAEDLVAAAQSRRTSECLTRYGSLSSRSSFQVSSSAQPTDADAEVDAAKLAVVLVRKERDRLLGEVWKARQGMEGVGKGGSRGDADN
ncbi:hypothetical protein PtrV1_12737 [Pyrenophora tritici-repentis]|nr:hypothetical protein PtrV1_12737 [Pyrenophora tritici-repentis]KAF7445548.1 hypothetical protein A1F99_105340 [Pyrenophora tritici-repentis]KAI0574775.1 hypothetical protein Alg215_08410 [Pyrenophora tritici-repentis]KAI1564534.1 hypothetical protein PtrEW4_008770 [Pyrenophora tritici-repentis]KAI1573307.1 hypothetical protein PtrEW7m1_007189 [Pyrenophora tritici-repentis]